MNKVKSPKLPEDPSKALIKLADHIDKITSARKIPPGADRRSFNEMTVPLSLLHELHGYAYEARRIAKR